MYQGNKQVRSAGEEIEYTKDMIDEYIRCKEDIIYFAENYFYITTIDHGKIKIPLYEFQKKVLKAYTQPPDGKSHIITMMARQMGKCFFSDSMIKIRNKKTNEIKELSIIEFFEMIKNKDESHI
jgi:hypothetical protein